MTTRTRLSREDRADQLLDLGAELFASRSYEDVHIEEIAELAEVSRGLLYHYYPTKRAFFAALVRREAARMVDLTQPDPSLPIIDQLSFGIDVYLEHCKQHAKGVKVVYSGWGSVDPEVQQIIQGDLRIQEDRIVEAVNPDKPATQFLRIAVRGWLAFVRSACHDWLDADSIPREAVRDMCAHALIGTLAALPADSRPSAITELLPDDGRPT